MKILFFIDGLRLGGKERRLIELLKGLKKHTEFEIVVASVWKDISYKEFYQLDIPIFFIEKKRKFDPSIFYKFYNLTRKIKPDIVHTWSSMNTSYSILAKIFSNFKLVNSQITNAPSKINCFSQFGVQTKLNFMFSDVILANSKAGLISYNAPISKSRYIHNGFDFKRISNLEKPDKIRERFNIRTKYVIGMVASFSMMKDYKTYVQTANMILKERDDITFLCVGAGDDTLDRKLVKPEFKESIKFLGRQENVESIINICDIGVLATYTEGISNVIIEYMVMSKPVIASEGGGTAEIVKNNQTGFLVKPRSSKELYEKIIFLLDNQQIAVGMGKAGRKVIEEEFNLKKMVQKFVNVYQGIST